MYLGEHVSFERGRTGSTSLQTYALLIPVRLENEGPHTFQELSGAATVSNAGEESPIELMIRNVIVRVQNEDGRAP